MTEKERPDESVSVAVEFYLSEVALSVGGKRFSETMPTIVQNCTSILSQAFDYILSIIKDKSLRDKMYVDTYIAGGCITSIAHGETPKDWDLFFRSKDVFREFVDYLRTERTLSANGELKDNDSDGFDLSGLNYFMQDGKLVGSFPLTFLSKRAFTVTGKDDMQVQFISRVIGPPEKVLKSFDYLHTQMAWNPVTGFEYSKKTVAPAIMTKTLVYVDAHDPLASYLRAIKLMKRGFDFPVFQAIQLADAIHKDTNFDTSDYTFES